MKINTLVLVSCLLTLPANVNSITKFPTKIKITEEQVSKLRETIKHKEEITNYLKDLKIDHRFTEADRDKIFKLCKDLNLNERGLYKCILHESSGNPQAVNKISRATGIIQWTPRTAKKYKTTVEEIYKMTMSEQIDLLYEYFKDKRNLKSYREIRLAVFSPKHMRKSIDYILADSTTEFGKKIIAQNPGLDINKDGIITIGEFIYKESKCTNSKNKDVDRLEETTNTVNI